MKRISKILIMFSIIMIMLITSSYAAENEFVIVKKIEYINSYSSTLKQGFVKILVGQLDFTKYANDEYIKITPKPDQINYDDFGNMYIYYSAVGMRPKEKLDITIERKMKISSFATDEPVLARSNGSVTEENKKYVKPQLKIESDKKEIINKANELTQDLTTDYRKAAAIFEYVNTKMSYDTSETYANKGAAAALSSSRGVCEEFATLFVALCRAEEIPSRVVAGYKVEKSNGKETLIDHTWAEIYLDDYGWLPVEPTIFYEVNGQRMPYWNTFCALNTVDHIPTELYYSEEAFRTYQLVTEVDNSYSLNVFGNNNIVEPEKNRFVDIDSYGWAADQIQNLFELGIVKGYSDFEYGPARNISRIEFMTMLSRTLAYFNENCNEKANVYYYPSYSRNHWSKPEYDYLMRCYQFYTPSDVMSAGYTNVSNVFGDGANLERAITRGEAVALMDLFLGEDAKWNTFRDVSRNSKFASSIAKAYASGIIDGYPDGTFKPNNTITRAEMACVLGRYITNNSYLIK